MASRSNKTEAKTETETKPVDVSVNDETALAYNMGHSIVGNEAFNKKTNALLDASEEVKRSPLTMLWALQDAGLDLSKFAKPGTKQGDNMEDGRPVENYTKTVKDTATGESKSVRGNWFTDFTAGLAPAIYCLERIADIKLAASVENAGKSKYYQAFKNDPIYLANEKDTWTQRLSTLRNLVRNATRIHDKQGEIDTRLEGIAHWDVAEYQVTEDGKTVTKQHRTSKPFLVIDTKKPQRFKTLAVGQFLKLNVGKAIENGNTFDALLATLENKEPETPEGKVPVIETVETSHDYVDGLTLFMEQHEGAILNAMNKPNGDALVKSYGAMYYALDSIFSKIQGKYDRLTAADLEKQGEKKAS